MRTYYNERKTFVSRILALFISAKVGHISQIISQATFVSIEEEPFLMKMYPDTDEGKEAFMQAIVLTTCQHLFGISLYIVGIILLNKNQDLARKVNPIIITFAFVIELPIVPIYTQWYLFWACGSQFGMSFAIPWLICDSFAGQLTSWLLIFGSMDLALHRSTTINSSYTPQIEIGFIAVSFMINFLVTRDLMIAYKSSVSQKIRLIEQRDEF